jgi:hypothetical protein
VDHLTFDPVDETAHALYQGVYFKFGSLVGISGSEAWNVNSTTLYVPNYNVSYPETSSWRASTVTAVGWGSWGGIPYISVLSGDYPLFLYENSDPTHYGNKQGDICHYIGETGAGPKGYRMQTYDELSFGACGTVGSFTALLIDDDSNQAWSGGTPAGTGIMPSYTYLIANSNIRIPPSGWRTPWGESLGYTPGRLDDQLGRYAYYRGGSIGNYGGDAWVYINGGYIVASMEGMTSRITCGLPVRCIKKLPGE